MSRRYHRQVKGKNKGKWVPCPAVFQCRLQNETNHISAELYEDVQIWLKDQGINKPAAEITDSDIRQFHMNFGYMNSERYQPGSTSVIKPLDIPDSTLPANNRVRYGLNNPETPSQLLSQLDSEGALFYLSLTDDEASAISQYTGHAHEYVNAYHREGPAGVENYVRNRYSPSVVPHNEDTFNQYVSYATSATKNLDSIFAKHERINNNKRVLYRAQHVKGEVNAWLDKNIKVGETYSDKAYVSTSLDSDYVLVHGGKEPEQTVVFEILTNKGIPIHNPKSSPGNVSYAEREVLLNRESKFKVVNVTTATYKTTWPEGKPKGHSAYKDALPKTRFTVVQLVEE